MLIISNNTLVWSRLQIKGLAARKSEKRLRDGTALSKQRNLKREKQPSIVSKEIVGNITENDADAGDTAKEITRSSVLKACTITSGALLALGLLIRQVSHIAFVQQWVNIDASTQVSFGFEAGHIEFFERTWPVFSESSSAANEQPLDYLVVAFLPGINEELLFQGALLPSLGLNWKSALVTGAIFGVLHLGSSRKYSFAIWATFVGFSHGLATIISSSAVVPKIAHSLNNLIGGFLWNYMHPKQTKINQP